MKKLIWPARIAASLLVAAGVAFAVLWFFPSDRYLLIPDDAHPLAGIVTVTGKKPKPDGSPGGIYYLDVKERKASLLEDFFPSFRDEGASIVPSSAVKPPGVSDRQSQQINLQDMARSQDIAAAVAERAAGYRVVASPDGALVAYVDPTAPAAGKLVPNDVITAVDGRRVRTPFDLRRLISNRRPGRSVKLTVRGTDGLRTVTMRTIATPQDRRRAMIGIVSAQQAQIDMPIPVTVDTGNVGGPSAGLALALEIFAKLGHDVDRGYKVAATGEIFLDGSVGRIGGVRQKIFGARQSDVDILLVPAGDNARAARSNAGHVRVIPVKTFAQALRTLATLPPKS
jgi:Lon-like protease